MTRLIPNLKQFLLLFFISSLLLGLDSIKILALPKQLVSYATTPVSFGLYQTFQNTSRQFYFIFASRFAAQENKALKEQLGQFLSENTSLKKRLAEAEAQLTQFEFISPSTYNLVAARPVGLGRYLKIDKGLTSGVKVGAAVVFKDNYIGRIKEVSARGANIQLLADPDSKVGAFSQGLKGHAKGVIVGQFGTEIVMDKILHEESSEIGDLVYSEGTEGYLPRGLILGKITEVLEQQNEVFKQAKVKPIFDIRDLELVFVIVE